MLLREIHLCQTHPWDTNPFLQSPLGNHNASYVQCVSSYGKLQNTTSLRLSTSKNATGQGTIVVLSTGNQKMCVTLFFNSLQLNFYGVASEKVLDVTMIIVRIKGCTSFSQILEGKNIDCLGTPLKSWFGRYGLATPNLISRERFPNTRLTIFLNGRYFFHHGVLYKSRRTVR